MQYFCRIYHISELTIGLQPYPDMWRSTVPYALHELIHYWQCYMQYFFQHTKVIYKIFIFEYFCHYGACLLISAYMSHTLLSQHVQYIPRNMHTVFALLCFVVVIHWLIFPYPSGLLHWHCGNLTIAPVPAKQPWLVWINTSCEFIMNDCITTTKQITTKPCAYFLGYTVKRLNLIIQPKMIFYLCSTWRL